MNNVMRPALSWTLLFLCNFMWAMQFTCIKLVEGQVGPLFTVWAPMTLSTLMLYPLIRRERGVLHSDDRKPKSDVLLFFVLAAVGVFPGQVFMTWGTQMSTASNAAVMQLTLPVSTALLAVVLLGERMGALRWLSFGVALLGVLLCSEADLWRMDLASRYLPGNLLVLAGTLGSAFYNSYGKRVLNRYSPMEMLFYTYVAMFVLMTPLTVWRESASFTRIPEFTSDTWIGLAVLTFFHNFLSMVLFLKALKQLDAIQAALCNYLITFFGVPLAVLWLGERPTLQGVLGGVLILGSTLLITLWENRRDTLRHAHPG